MASEAATKLCYDQCIKKIPFTHRWLKIFKDKCAEKCAISNVVTPTVAQTKEPSKTMQYIIGGVLALAVIGIGIWLFRKFKK